MPGKNIYFYEVSSELTLTNHGDNFNLRLHEIFSYCFPRPGSYDSESSRVTYDIIKSTDKCLFGKYSRRKNISPSSMMQERELETNATGPVGMDATKQLENFTYFLLDYNKKILAEIFNSYLPRIEKVLPESVKEMHNELSSIIITPYKASREELNKRIKNVDQIVSVSASFKRTEEQNVIRSLEEELGCEAEWYSIKMKLNFRKPSIIDNLLGLSEKVETNSVVVHTINEAGLEEPLDLVKMLIVKKATLELTDDMVFNHNLIYAALSQNLNAFARTYLS